jgi:hypothetical protein
MDLKSSIICSPPFDVTLLLLILDTQPNPSGKVAACGADGSASKLAASHH